MWPIGGECLCSTGAISSLSRRPSHYRALPLFLPGVMDMQTGEDVRKGSLGSV